MRASLKKRGREKKKKNHSSINLQHLAHVGNITKVGEGVGGGVKNVNNAHTDTHTLTYRGLTRSVQINHKNLQDGLT